MLFHMVLQGSAECTRPSVVNSAPEEHGTKEDEELK